MVLGNFFFCKKKIVINTSVSIYIHIEIHTIYTWSCATKYVTCNAIETCVCIVRPQENRSFTDCLENLKSSTQRGIEDRLLPFTLEIGLDQCGLCAPSLYLLSLSLS